MCQEFCSQGGFASVHAGYHHHPPPDQAPPWNRHPPGPGPPRPGTPPDQPPPPPEQTPSRDQATRPQEQTPLGADTPPPCAVHAVKYGQQAGGMHPTGMQSCSILRRSFRVNWYD